MEDDFRYCKYTTQEICPVCKQQCTSVHWYDEGFNMDTNEQFSCNRCGYKYEYAYGYDKEFINNKEYLFGDYGNDNAYLQFKKKRYKEIKKVRKLLYRNGKIKGKKLGINKNSQFYTP